MESVHYFHSYSVLDRIDRSHLSNAKPTLGEIELDQLLPSMADHSSIKSDFEVLVSR